MTHKRDEILKLSPHVVMQEVGREYVVYHSLFGHPTRMNAESVQVLRLFSNPRSATALKREYSIEDLDRWVQTFRRKHFLVAETADEREEIRTIVQRECGNIAHGRRFRSLGLVLHEACNFNCTYCISMKMMAASGRSFPKPRRMTLEVAQQAIDATAAYCRSKGKRKLEVYFGGSEPLLNWQVLQRTISYCLERYGTWFDFTFSLNTNASLMTPERAEFLTKHHAIVTTSLDGLEQANDIVRRSASGKGTFRRIMTGWENMKEAGTNVEWFCLTLTDANFDAVNEAFFDFLSERRITTCSIEPDIITPLRREPDDIAAALVRFKRMGLARGITVGGMWDKPFKNMFQTKILKHLFSCSVFTGRGFCVLPNGDLVSCIYSGEKLGSLRDFHSFFASPRYLECMQSHAIGAIPACQGCEIEGQCIGGCALSAEFDQYHDSTRAFEYRCAVYRSVTRQLLASHMSDGSMKRATSHIGGGEPR